MRETIFAVGRRYLLRQSLMVGGWTFKQGEIVTFEYASYSRYDESYSAATPVRMQPTSSGSTLSTHEAASFHAAPRQYLIRHRAGLLIHVFP